MSSSCKLLFAFLFFPLFLNAQDPVDLTGKWHGTSNWLKSVSHEEVEMKQEGSQVEVTIRSSIANDSTKYSLYTLSGTFEDGILNLAKGKFIDRTNKLACIPSMRLKLTIVGENILLEGRWKHSLVKNGCLPGVSGRISLIKEVEKEMVLSRPVVNQDVYSEELIKGLRERTYHALIITIGEYESEAIVDLDRPVPDGRALAQVLSDEYTFEEGNITQLENPTREGIITAFEDVSEKMTQRDHLLVFYAGHGIWDDKLEQGYWLPSDADTSSRSQWISNATIRDYIRSIGTKHTLLIADACFSGGILKERNAFITGKAMVQMYRLTSRKAITSGTLTTVPDQSVFLEYLVKNLEDNSEDLISADQLFYYLKIAVLNNSPNQQVPQYGAIHQADDEGGDFIFLRKME